MDRSTLVLHLGRSWQGEETLCRIIFGMEGVVQITARLARGRKVWQLWQGPDQRVIAAPGMWLQFNSFALGARAILVNIHVSAEPVEKYKMSRENSLFDAIDYFTCGNHRCLKFRISKHHRLLIQTYSKPLHLHIEVDFFAMFREIKRITAVNSLEQLIKQRWNFQISAWKV